MKFQGKISKVLPELKGTSATGKEWRKVSYVLTYDVTKPEYPRQVVFDVMGDRIDELKLQEGHTYELDIDFQVREYNGKYYMSASCWRATSMEAPQPVVAYQQPIAQPTPVVVQPISQPNNPPLPINMEEIPF